MSQTTTSTIRTGRVSTIDYKAGTYEVTYFDRGQSVTRKINAQSNGEYKMPKIGQIVAVNHNSNGPEAAVTTGTVWNQSNKPAEGYEGLYRKEFGNSNGEAYERYDSKAGTFSQVIQGAASYVAGGMLRLLSNGASILLKALTDVGISAGQDISAEAAGTIRLEAKEDLNEVVGGKKDVHVTGNATYALDGDATIKVGGVTVTVSGGKVSIDSPAEISLSAPVVNIKGASGEVEINGVKLTEHTHAFKHTDETDGVTEKPR